jgi:SAM-dependent methyltransferase
MPDPIFAHPRLVALYDRFDGDRSDLDLYVAMVDEFGATSVLDVGCGTGSLAVLLAAGGVEVIGVDPAAASIAEARRKPGSALVRWICGDATQVGLTDCVDLAVMTGNVAQVFVDDAAWAATLASARHALRVSGRLVFETRDPGRRAWDGWNAGESREEHDVPGEGRVVHWVDVVEEAPGLVSFRWTFEFDDGTRLESDSTLRFRTRAELDASVRTAGFVVDDVRDAPDRPGCEWVYVCRAV